VLQLPRQFLGHVLSVLVTPTIAPSNGPGAKAANNAASGHDEKGRHDETAGYNGRTN
jgi:hypothetical protein